MSVRYVFSGKITGGCIIDCVLTWTHQRQGSRQAVLKHVSVIISKRLSKGAAQVCVQQ